MPASPCRFIKRIWEEFPKDQFSRIPPNTRGIYALLQREHGSFRVVYIGMSSGERLGICSRLKGHAASKSKKWDHFSVLEVHDNLDRADVAELEAILRFLYRKDHVVNAYNKQRRSARFLAIREPRPSRH